MSLSNKIYTTSAYIDMLLIPLAYYKSDPNYIIKTILDEILLGVMNQRLLIRAPYAKTVDFIHVNLSGLSFSPKLEIHIKFILGNF